MTFYAHLRQGAKQTVTEHCRSAAGYARNCLNAIGLAEAAYLAGLLHDAGKMKQAFSDYLRFGGTRGSVNHSFAVCRWLLERFHGREALLQSDLTAELLAYAVGGHHGLFDCVNEDGHSGFLHRMETEGIDYQESMDNFLAVCASDEELSQRFQAADKEISAACGKIAALTTDGTEACFYIGLLARLLLSAVIEGDRRDTAEFMNAVAYPAWKPNWEKYLQNVEEKIAQFPQDVPIRKARKEISDRCRSFAKEPGGIYRLNVPTGAGKTLSSLRFALAHAKQWGYRRIIFTAPLLAILEQNGAVLRQYIGDDSVILEHHSNALEPKEGEGLDNRELAVESWDAPIIITTLVQLLNTLFAGKTTSIRRFQSLCNSVIVIDEVQTVPQNMVSLFNLAMNFLSEICGATVLLCSATQPCFEKTHHSLHGQPPDMIAYDEALWSPFQRTVITDAGGMHWEDFVSFVGDALQESQSLLVVCNKRSQAQRLFQEMKGEAEVCCHLSASMCTAHRRAALEKLNMALAEGKKCLCVSTQVIEAGVDISFSRVIRLCAGMDSMIQSAGRCNRNGESGGLSPVYIVSLLGEELSRLPEIKKGKDATLGLLDAYHRQPEEFDRNLSSDKAIARYYQRLYASNPVGYQDYTLGKGKESLYRLLSLNQGYWDDTSPFARRFMLKQAFRQAGSQFKVFESNSRDVVVPYGDGVSLIAELAGQAYPDGVFLSDWLRRASAYTVAMYDYQLRDLAGALTEYSGILVLSPEFYDTETGFEMEPKELAFLEV